MKAGKLRGAYKACDERNCQVVKLITSLKSEHPYWGYRRIWANLKHFYRVNISLNTVYALMSKHGLLSKKYSKKQSIENNKIQAAGRQAESVLGNRYDQGFDADGVGLYYGCAGLVQQKSCGLPYRIAK